MTDPLGVTSAVAGIVTATLESAHFLIKTIDSIKGAPTTIADVRSEFNALHPVLKQIQQQAQDSGGNAPLSNAIVPAMQNCETACNKFQAQLDRWMRHSKGDKMFWMDRWKVGLFGEDRTQALRSQLGDCKATLSVALSTGTYIQQAKAETDEQEKSDMLETQRDGLMWKIQRAERDYDALEQNFQQVSVNVYTQVNNIQPEPEVEESRQELILELQRQMASKETLEKAFEESLTDFHEELTGARVTRTHASDHGRAYAGFIGGNPKDFKGKLDVSDTTATSHGFAAAGVVNGVHFPKD